VLQFQGLMSQFLQTQDAVMAGYFQSIGGTDAARAAALAPAPRLAFLPVSVGPPAPPATPPDLGDALTRRPPAPSAASSAGPNGGNGANGANGGNGREASLPQEKKGSAPRPTAAPPPAPSGPVDHATRFLQIVSERTGYPREILRLDSSIEGDLGIDSIKRVEILSAFQRQCSPAERTKLAGGDERSPRSGPCATRRRRWPRSWTAGGRRPRRAGRSPGAPAGAATRARARQPLS
jgi:hypothetical protein